MYYIQSTCCSSTGSDVFSTSTDGEVMWWDIRKLVEPVETLQLEFAGYMPGQRLGGICMEYESTMVRPSLIMVNEHTLLLLLKAYSLLC